MGNREPEGRRRDADVRRLSRITAVVGALTATATVGFGVLAGTATGHVGHSGATATTTSTSGDSSTQAVESDDTPTGTATSPPAATSETPVAVSGGS